MANSINKEEGFRYSFNDGEIILSLRDRPVIYDTLTNIVYGKESGCIFLLSGSPGTGKSLTAEAIAEILHKPLYKIS